MIRILALWQLATADSARVCMVDAQTRAPLSGVEVSVSPDSTHAPSLFHRLPSPCTQLVVGRAQLRRVGYRSRIVNLSGTSHAIEIALDPLAGARDLLDTVRVSAIRGAVRAGDALGRISNTLTVESATRMGASTTAQLIERMPFANVRSARGETGLSLRAGRREQVLVTLDGLALNDPATGTADVSDVPLLALASATLVPGADPIGAGPGASGGVVALTTGATRALAVRGGSLGQRSLDAAWSDTMAGASVSLAAMRRASTNDFTFSNDAAADGPHTERRSNNDESRTAVVGGVVSSAWQLAAMFSRADRGMVGPENVHAYDQDRSRTDRLLLRGQVMRSPARVSAGLRSLQLQYRDPSRPALDATSRATSGDMDVTGNAVNVGNVRDAPVSLDWRGGAGTDGVTASGGLSQSRVRGFALADARWSATLARVQAGVRVDAMTGAGALPSFSLAAERAVTSHWTLAGRVTQAMRAPTLYDLYFASPQRVEVRALKPERVIADGEISLRFARTTTFGFIQSSVAMVARNTRDAIVWFPGNFGWSPANVGRERVVGGEVNVALTSGWGEFATWATAYDATLTVGALSIPTPYVPRVATGSRLVAHWRSATVAATSRTMSRRPFSAGPRNRDYELPAVTLLDLALTHESPLHLAPTIATTFTWTVENALDTSWQSVRGFPSPGRTWSVTCTLRHSPRS